MSNFFGWLYRYIKGVIIGAGAILPGVSGGALCAVFGVYERLISFIAHLNRDFKKNALFLLPVALGAISGFFVLSSVLSYFLESRETELVWFFIGCIAGIVPLLFKEAGKKGRKANHMVIMLAAAAVTLTLLLWLKPAETAATGVFTIWDWGLAGAIFALGMVIPGLSPSNFLIFMGIYKPMLDGITALDFSVIIPLVAGGVMVVLSVSKLFDYVFNKAYAIMFHAVLGVVAASTVIIIPVNTLYTPQKILGSVLCCLCGVLLGVFMGRLEKRLKETES